MQLEREVGARPPKISVVNLKGVNFTMKNTGTVKGF